MAKYLKGILGSFSGLVGNIVGSSWNGIDVMRSRPKPSNALPTPAQLEQRERFSLMSSFMKPLSDVIKIGFQAYNYAQTPYNAAFGRNLEQAITGAYPTLTIDYPKFVMSKGPLLGISIIMFSITEAAQVDFSWVNNAQPGSTNGTDKLSLIAYNPAQQAFVTSTAAALRSATSFDLAMPALWSGDNVHIWAFFVRADGKQTSDSVYVGANLLM